MTLTRVAHSCPLCFKVYAAMSNHLRRTHVIANRDERKLLLNLSSGHVNIRSCPCPVGGCTYRNGRLDQHLKLAHLGLSADQRESYTQSVRKAKTVSLLQDLRKTEPSPPMVSSIDTEEEGIPGWTSDHLFQDGEQGERCPRSESNETVLPPESEQSPLEGSSLGARSKRNQHRFPVSIGKKLLNEFHIWFQSKGKK